MGGGIPVQINLKRFFNHLFVGALNSQSWGTLYPLFFFVGIFDQNSRFFIVFSPYLSKKNTLKKNVATANMGKGGRCVTDQLNLKHIFNNPRKYDL